jgi:hypothetical protein
VTDEEVEQKDPFPITAATFSVTPALSELHFSPVDVEPMLNNVNVLLNAMMGGRKLEPPEPTAN